MLLLPHAPDGFDAGVDALPDVEELQPLCHDVELCPLPPQRQALVAVLERRLPCQIRAPLLVPHHLKWEVRALIQKALHRALLLLFASDDVIQLGLRPVLPEGRLGQRAGAALVGRGERRVPCQFNKKLFKMRT